MVIIHNEASRKCGFRKPGGIYLVSDGPMAACDNLPIPVNKCPTCGEGIFFSRGFTWFNPQELFQNRPTECGDRGDVRCLNCPVGGSRPPKAGLIWIGSMFYKTPEEWTDEATIQGVSRRISMIPRELKIGETWIYVAHQKAVDTPEGKKPGIFHAFKPTRLEYILKGDETEDDIKKLEKRGLTLVNLTRG